MPEMSETPARFARWTKALSKEINAAPGGLLLRCIASANSIPDAVSASAAANDDSSSTVTFLRPSSLVNAVRIALSSNPYRLRSTQPVSRRTVFAIHIGPSAKRARAAAACLGSSPVSSRTTTLVSTAVMASHYFPANGGAHLRGCLRFAIGPQTTGHFVEIGFGETCSGAEQNSVAGFFDCEFRSRPPGPGNTDTFG